MRDWGLPVVREALARVYDHLDTDGLSLAALEDDARPGPRPARGLLDASDRRGGARLGRLSGRDRRGHGGRAVPLAEPYAPADLFALVGGRARMREHIYFWTDGALAMTAPTLRTSLRALRSVRARGRGGPG